MRILLGIVTATMLAATGAAAEGRLPIFDAHIHYSHDAWEMLPPPQAVEVLRKAGLKKAFVSSSSDQGTQMLYAEAPDLIVPVLRPYRKRGELGTWYRDESVIQLLTERLNANTYAGIGEFHIYGQDTELPVMRAVVRLAKEHGIFLHLHGDAEAVDNVFRQNPEARVLWAHSGFDSPANVRAMLDKHQNLWADLAVRGEQATGGKVDPDWRALFEAHPDRIMLGTDTYAPERWYYVEDHAQWSREWLADLPPDLAERIAHRNAQTLADWALKK